MNVFPARKMKNTEADYVIAHIPMEGKINAAMEISSVVDLLRR